MTAQSSVAVQSKKKRVGISLTQLAMRRLRRDRLTLTALAIVALMAIMSFSAPLISRVLDVSYTQTDASRTFLPLAGNHILGTDDCGSLPFRTVVLSADKSLAVGFLAAIVSISIGVTLGIITGFYGGPI